MLIVEPEASLRILLREVLEQEGYGWLKPRTAMKGSRAVALPKGVTLDIRYLIVW
jgi:hypothetical protein